MKVITMRIEPEHFKDVSAVHAQGFWYNVEKGSFKQVGEEVVPTNEKGAASMWALFIYEFEYRHPKRLSHVLRMQIRDDLITAVQYATQEGVL
jgi:hypothetical protein